MICEHPILDAKTDGKQVYVLWDYTDFPEDMQANNLECYNGSGEPVWCSLSPIQSANSAYTNFVSISPELIVGNFAGCDATIDKATGNVISTKFTK